MGAAIAVDRRKGRVKVRSVKGRKILEPCTLEGIDWQVDGVKITIDQTEFQDWNEIDAVELVGIAE